MTNVNPLADLVNEAMERQGMDAYDVEKRAKSLGLPVSYRTVENARTGHRVVRQNAIKGLAAGLGLPLEQVREAAENTEGIKRAHGLPEFELLNDENKQAVRSFTRALLDTQQKTERLEAAIHETIDRADEIAKENAKGLPRKDAAPWAKLRRELAAERKQLDQQAGNA